ncbi:hypothetical protein PHISP_07431 [Aspergillus sp. HF37]|nr:hypothetical protein PHISP_07431 [Aspergillus sp. HF37]
MIDNYDNLPPYMFFIHAQRFQWHNDDPDYDGVPLLRSLQLAYLREQGYVNMRCVWAVGCPSEIYPFVDEGGGTEEKEDVTARMVFRTAFQEILPEKEVPQVVSASCCAQFALTREMVCSRPREDYIRMRQWLLDTPLTDSLAGRVFEYSWHIMFGFEGVNCPSAGECYCKVYDRCDMQCEEDSCEERYQLPPFSTLPEGWPYIGWHGETRNFSGPP